MVTADIKFIKIGGRNINNFRYADDTTLMAVFIYYPLCHRLIVHRYLCLSLGTVFSFMDLFLCVGAYST